MLSAPPPPPSLHSFIRSLVSFTWCRPDTCFLEKKYKTQNNIPMFKKKISDYIFEYLIKCTIDVLVSTLNNPYYKKVFIK